MRPCLNVLPSLFVVLSSVSAHAAGVEGINGLKPETSAWVGGAACQPDEPVAVRQWHVVFGQRPQVEPAIVGGGPALRLGAPLLAAIAQEPASQRPIAVEYSDFYRLRQKVHRYASFAMLPLFIAEAVVGQKLYTSDAGEGMRSAHTALAAGTGVLFGVNTITGGWNLWEGRKDRSGRFKRVLHGLLMLAADGGFLATAALAPEHEHGEREGNRSLHRSVALTSMGVATASYLIMLVGR